MNTENSSSGSVVEEIKMREEIEKVCSLKGAIEKKSHDRETNAWSSKDN
jgi:hypothetical protein